jgi:glycosyltransferase involved in cell wall biosynthesis
MSREAQVNVVRVGDPYYLGLMGWLLSRLLRVPLAIRVCFNYDQLYEMTGNPVFPRLFGFRAIEKIVEKFVFPRCALIAGANQNNLDYAIDQGATPGNGVVFRYGNLIYPLHFTEPAARGDGESLVRELGVEGDFLATVCRLEKMKQPDECLRVLRKLLALGHDVKFVYIGDGSMRAQLAGMVNTFGLGGRVIFAGNRPQEWIAKVLPQARLVLSPHMGRALTEACLAGAPIVAYDYDWQGEIICSGETGELVPDGDWEQMAIKASQLLTDPDRARAVGKAARKLAMEMMNPKALDSIEVSSYEALFHRTARPLAQGSS